MKKVLTVAGLGAALIAGPLLGAAIADASPARFQQRAQEEMPFVVQQYGLAAVQSEGMQICAWEAQGITDTSRLVDLTIAEMPMSRSAAIQLKVLAEFHLGC
jgi:hypothetical protein